MPTDEAHDGLQAPGILLEPVEAADSTTAKTTDRGADGAELGAEA